MKIQYIVLALAAIAVVSYLILTATNPAAKPSCSDGVRNQGESDVDCGGPCKACPTSNLPCAERADANERSKCFMNQAVGSGNASVCDYIEIEFFKDDCLKGIAKNTNDTSPCGRISSPLGSAECLRDVAIETMNPKLCASIADITQRDSCYYRVAIDSKDVSACAGITSDSSQKTCTALLSKNSAYCDEIKDENGRDWCYNKVASLNPDAKTCTSIHSMQTKDLCYKMVAAKKISFDLCAVIQNTTLRDGCLVDVEEARKHMEEMQNSISGGGAIKPA
jgi:hypothetical protein